jgi:hypothetical protein
MKSLTSYPLCVLVALSLASGINETNASPHHPRRAGRLSGRYSINKSSRNRKYDSLETGKEDGVNYSTEQKPIKERYTSFDFSFGATPLHVQAASPQAAFVYHYQNVPGDFQYRSSKHWSNWNESTPSGTLKLEFGNYSGFFFGLGFKFSGGIGNTQSEIIEIGYNYSLPSNPSWKIRPSLSFIHTETKVWFPDQIDNHDKDAVIFGNVFPYAKRQCSRSSCRWIYSDAINVGIQNSSNGLLFKLGIGHDFSKTISCQINFGYNFYFGNTFQLYAQSKNNQSGFPLDSPGLNFSLGAPNPNQLFSYDGLFADFTLSIRFHRTGHHSHHRYS